METRHQPDPNWLFDVIKDASEEVARWPDWKTLAFTRRHQMPTEPNWIHTALYHGAKQLRACPLPCRGPFIMIDRCVIDEEKEMRCKNCEGWGWIPKTTLFGLTKLEDGRSSLAYLYERIPCPDCQGSGVTSCCEVHEWWI